MEVIVLKKDKVAGGWRQVKNESVTCTFRHIFG
jgi:hypothetical protein